MNIFEVSPRDYHTLLTCNRANIHATDSFLSKSVLWELDKRSLWKWRYHARKIEPTAAMQWGSLVDCLATTPELLAESVAVSPFDSYRTKEARDWRDAQLAAKRILATKEDIELAQQAAKMLTQTCKASADIFAKSKSQVIIAGRVIDVKFKGLVDLAPEGEDFLADLKTCSDFSLEGFSNAVPNSGYHVQAGVYLALWNAMFPEDQRTRVKFIWQESEAPFETCVTELSQPDIEAGWLYASVWCNASLMPRHVIAGPWLSRIRVSSRPGQRGRASRKNLNSNQPHNEPQRTA